MSQNGEDLWIEALKVALESDTQAALSELRGLQPFSECRDSVNVELVLLVKAGDTIVAEVRDRGLWLRVLQVAINDDALIDAASGWEELLGKLEQE